MLPQIFMYSSVSQPHSIGAGGSSEREGKPPVNGDGSRVGGGDMGSSLEVVGNAVTPRHSDTAPSTVYAGVTTTRSYTALATTGTAPTTRSGTATTGSYATAPTTRSGTATTGSYAAAPTTRSGTATTGSYATAPTSTATTGSYATAPTSTATTGSYAAAPTTRSGTATTGSYATAPTSTATTGSYAAAPTTRSGTATTGSYATAPTSTATTGSYAAAPTTRSGTTTTGSYATAPTSTATTGSYAAAPTTRSGTATTGSYATAPTTRSYTTTISQPGTSAHPAHTTLSNRTPLPFTSTSTTTAPNVAMSLNPGVVAVGDLNHAHHHHVVPLPPTREPSQFIGTDSRVVRPTQSDFAAVRRRHPGLVPTPIPMTSGVTTNPLKMLTSHTETTPLSLLGNLQVIPHISTGPGSKKDLVKKTSDNKMIYNSSNDRGENTQLFPGVDKGGIKITTRGPIQPALVSLDMEDVPIHLHNSHNLAPSTRNMLDEKYKGNLMEEESAPVSNQKLISMDHSRMGVAPTHLLDSQNLMRNVSTDGGMKQNLDSMMSGNEKLMSLTGISVRRASQTQQNLRNELDADKLGLAIQPRILSQKMMTTGPGLVPMLNSHNTTSFNNPSLPNDMSLAKNSLKAKTIELDKLSKSKGPLNIKITGDSDTNSNMSPEYVGSKSLGVDPLVVSQNTTTTPSPVTNSPQFPAFSNYTSPSSSLGSNAGHHSLPPTPTTTHQPNDVSPTSSIGSSSLGNPPTPAPAAPSSPLSPAIPPHLPPSAPATLPHLPVSANTRENTMTGETPLFASGSCSEEDCDSAGESDSETSTTLTSGGGPLVEYIDSHTYVDNQQQMTSLSSNGTVGKAEGEGEGEGGEGESEDDEDDNEKMPELEEIPEVESRYINLKDPHHSLIPTPNTTTPDPPEPLTDPTHHLPSPADQPPPGGSGVFNPHQKRESGGAQTAAKKGSSLKRATPPTHSNHTPGHSSHTSRPPTSKGSGSSPLTKSDRKRDTSEQQWKRNDGMSQKKTQSQSVPRTQNKKQSPSPRGPGRQGANQPSTSSRGREQPTPPGHKHGSSSSQTKPLRRTEGPNRKASPGPQQSGKIQRK